MKSKIIIPHCVFTAAFCKAHVPEEQVQFLHDGTQKFEYLAVELKVMMIATKNNSLRLHFPLIISKRERDNIEPTKVVVQTYKHSRWQQYIPLVDAIQR